MCRSSKRYAEGLSARGTRDEGGHHGACLELVGRGDVCKLGVDGRLARNERVGSSGTKAKLGFGDIFSCLDADPAVGSCLEKGSPGVSGMVRSELK